MSDLQDEAREVPPDYGAPLTGDSRRTGEPDNVPHACARDPKVRRANFRQGRDGGIGREARRALREVAQGASIAHASRLTGISHSALTRLASSPAGRAYLAKHRERVDAHRVLLAATVPFLDLLRAIETGKRPVRTYIESSEDDAGE